MISRHCIHSAANMTSRERFRRPNWPRRPKLACILVELLLDPTRSIPAETYPCITPDNEQRHCIEATEAPLTAKQLQMPPHFYPYIADYPHIASFSPVASLHPPLLFGQLHVWLGGVG